MIIKKNVEPRKMKFIGEELAIPSRTVTTALYDADGASIVQGDKNRIYAKLSSSCGEKKHQYFVRMYLGVLFDPLGPDANRNIWNRTEMKAVKQEVFDFYLKYLQTKDRTCMTRAQRSLLNG